MNSAAEKGRRKFLKQALGFGTIMWMTPTILTVSAKKGHACLSGNSGGWDKGWSKGSKWSWDRGGSWSTGGRRGRGKRGKK